MRNMLEMRRLLLRLLPFSLLMLSFPALSQMYSWRDGASLKVSSIPPGWYRVERPVHGPRVVVTQGKRVIDDTGLRMGDRLRMRPVLRPQERSPVRN